MPTLHAQSPDLSPRHRDPRRRSVRRSVWHARSARQDGNAYGVFAQTFDNASGDRPGRRVPGQHLHLDQPELTRRVAITDGGSFVVVWNSFAGTGRMRSSGIFGRRFNSAGAALGVEFQVNSYSTDDQSRPDDRHGRTSGDFIVAWEGLGAAWRRSLRAAVRFGRCASGWTSSQITTSTPSAPPPVRGRQTATATSWWRADNGSTATGSSRSASSSGRHASGLEFGVNSIAISLMNYPQRRHGRQR